MQAQLASAELAASNSSMFWSSREETDNVQRQTQLAQISRMQQESDGLRTQLRESAEESQKLLHAAAESQTQSARKINELTERAERQALEIEKQAAELKRMAVWKLERIDDVERAAEKVRASKHSLSNSDAEHKRLDEEVGMLRARILELELNASVAAQTILDAAETEPSARTDSTKFWYNGQQLQVTQVMQNIVQLRRELDAQACELVETKKVLALVSQLPAQSTEKLRQCLAEHFRNSLAH